MCCLFSVFAIDISLVADFSGPSEKELKEIIGEKYIGRKYSRPMIVWGENDTLIYEIDPYYLRLDTKSGTYTFIEELYEKLGTRHRFISTFSSNDFMLFRYGDYGSFAANYFGMYDLNAGWKDISNIEQYNKMGRVLLSEEDLIGLMGLNVMEPLLGPYSLVPRPEITDFEELMLMDMQYLISLKDLQTGELTPLPKELESVRNDGLRVAVSFDRFQLAIIGLVVQETQDVPLRLDSKVYILKIVYDGTLCVEASLRAEPGLSGAELVVLPADIPLLVTDTALYERMEDGREDFWYQVNTDTQSGWVFGGDLRIEGDDWKKRLEKRGRLIEWEDLDDYFEYLKQDSHDIQIKETSEIENENLKNELVVLDSIDLLEETSNSLPETLSFNAKKSNRLWLQAIGLIAVGIFLAIALILWERRKK